MARCEICGKGPTVGNRVSHANNRTKRRWLPNVQRLRVIWEGSPKTMTVCASCLRSNRVAKSPGNLGAPKATQA